MNEELIDKFIADNQRILNQGEMLYFKAQLKKLLDDTKKKDEELWNELFMWIDYNGNDSDFVVMLKAEIRALVDRR